MKRVKKDENYRYIFYTFMNTDHSNLLKYHFRYFILFHRTGWEKRENNGGEESNRGTWCTYIVCHNVPLYTTTIY
jgi:hypothetical protein